MQFYLISLYLVVKKYYLKKGQLKATLLLWLYMLLDRAYIYGLLWVDKVIDVKRVNDCIIVVKFLIGKRIVTAVSVYTPQCGLSEEEKDRFYDELIAVTSKFGDNELVIVGSDFNGHVRKSSEGYVGVHVGFGFGSRNKEGERLLEFGRATDMVVCNTLFRKRLSRLITYESGGCQTQIDYILVR